MFAALNYGAGDECPIQQGYAALHGPFADLVQCYSAAVVYCDMCFFRKHV